MSADAADAVVALNNFFVSLGANYLRLEATSSGIQLLYKGSGVLGLNVTIAIADYTVLATR